MYKLDYSKQFFKDIQLIQDYIALALGNPIASQKIAKEIIIKADIKSVIAHVIKNKDDSNEQAGIEKKEKPNVNRTSISKTMLDLDFDFKK